MGGIQQTLDAWLCIDPHCSSSNFTTAHSPRISRLRLTPSSSSTTTGSHPRTRSWKAYWTRSSSRTTDPEAHIKKKRRKMEATEGDDTATWPSECENKFVQLLVELVNTGRIVNGSVHTNLWSPIASQLSDQTGRTYTAKQCRTKYTRLRMNHRKFSDLLNHRTGLGWDPISNTVQGTESQWQSYLRINRKAGRFRKKGCQNYEMLGLIFNGSTATGVLRHSSARTPPDSEKEEELNDALLRFGMHVNARGNMGDVVGIFEGAPVNGLGCVNGGDGGSVSMGGPKSLQYSGVVIGGRQLGKRQVDYCGPSSDSKKKGKGKGKESSESMDSLRSEALKEFVEVHRMKKEMMRAAQQNLNSGEGSAGVGGSGASFAIANSMSRALNILDDLAPNLDDQTYLRAFEQLREETIRDGFIAMPPSRRKAWLATL